jgi:hypothetical protein
MKRTLLLISLAAATTLAALQHEALAQQPTPQSGKAAATPAPEKGKKNPSPAKSGKKTPVKAAEPKTSPPPAARPAAMPPPPMVEIMPIDLPPPASNAPPAPTPPGAGSIAQGITPVRYGAPMPGSSRLIASVPVLPPKAAPMVELPAGAPLPPAPAQMAPAVAKVTPYTPPVFSPPVPARKPAWAQTQTVEASKPPGTVAAPPVVEQSAAAKPSHIAPGYTAVVPIIPFGATPPAPASQPAPEPITFTVRLPTIVMLEPKP